MCVIANALFLLSGVLQVLGGCVEDERYISPSAVKHFHDKRDLGVTEEELLDKFLKSELDKGIGHEKLLEDAKKYHYEESVKNPHRLVEEAAVSYHDEIPLEHDKKYGYLPHEKELKTEEAADVSEEQMKEFLLYLKSVLGDKGGLEELFLKSKETMEHGKEAASAEFNHDGAIKAHDKAGKFIADAIYHDNLEDKDLKAYLAESIYHLKKAADAEKHPHLKIAHEEDIHHKKVAEEEKIHEGYPHFKAHEADDAYLKKIDELGKSFHAAESYPHLKAEGHKIAEGEKTLFHAHGKAHAEEGFEFEKEAEEKALEEWKAKHKDLFKVEEYPIEEHLKAKDLHADEALHHKIKAEEEAAKSAHGVKLHEDEEFLKKHHGIFKEEELMHEEGTRAYEKAREKAIEDAKIHLTDEAHKHLEADKAFHGTKHHIAEGGFYDGKIHGLDEKIHLTDEAHKHLEADKAYHGTKHHIAEEGFYDSKIHGIDEKIHMTDEAHKHLEADKAFHGTKHHIAEEGFYDGKIHGIDEKLAAEIGKSLHEGKVHHIGETEKTHAAAGTYGFEKEKAVYGTKIAHGEEAAKAHGIGIALAHDDEKAVYGTKFAHDEEAMKSHGIGTSLVHDAEKAVYGTKIVHGEEAMKAHGIGTSLVHDAEKAVRDSKAYADGAFEEEKFHGFDAALAHKGKEILEEDEHFIKHGFEDEEAHILHGLETASKEHHAIGVDKVDKEIAKEHEKSHSLRHKFFEMLKKLLPFRKCHLVSMTPSELLSIVNCVSKSKDPLLCEKFAKCEKKMPPRVIAAVKKCQKETIPGEMLHCTSHAPLYPSSEIPLKIFQCTAVNVRELVPEEKKMMVEFEECARHVKAESCGRLKWFRRGH